MGARCAAFSSDAGVDDDVTGTGSVRFRVFVDGEAVADSDVMKRGDAPKKLSASLTGKHELVLEASNADDGNDYDHADWLNALVECEP